MLGFFFGGGSRDTLPSPALLWAILGKFDCFLPKDTLFSLPPSPESFPDNLNPGGGFSGWALACRDDDSWEYEGEEPVLLVGGVVGDLLPDISEASSELRSDGFRGVLVCGDVH